MSIPDFFLGFGGLENENRGQYQKEHSYDFYV
jgi:hypothetical protein